MSTKIIFMGTPDFAVPILTALLDSSSAGGWEVVAVVTQPDRPKGRGKKLTPPPIKLAAEKGGVKVLQPETLRTEEAMAELAKLKPDLIVVAAFGQILRQNLLDMPSHGCLNLHSSLLPRWRGAAPILAAIRAGDTETGITLMQVVQKLDAGPIISQRKIRITPEHTTKTLTMELANLGAELLVDTLPAWLGGEIAPQIQDNSLATMIPRLKKEDGAINWTKSAVEIDRLVRAYDPWPATFTYSPHGRFKVLSVLLAPDVPVPVDSEPGTVFKYQRKVYVTTGNGAICLVKLQPAGKREMDALAMLNGQPDLLGARLVDKNSIFSHKTH